MEKILWIFVAFFGITLVSAQVQQNSTCGSVSLMKEFDINKYTGLWYEIKTYGNNEGRKDFKYLIAYNSTSEIITVMYDGMIDNKNSTESYTTKKNDSSRLILNGKSSIFNHWILDTDYTTYSLVYGCTNNTHQNESTVTSWILGRNSTLIITNPMNDTLTKAGLSLNNFNNVSHTNGAMSTKAMILLIAIGAIWNIIL